MGVVVPAAAQESEKVTDESREVTEDIVTTDSVGAKAMSDAENAGITAENITVNHDGGNTATGAEADANAEGKSAEIKAEDVTVDASNVNYAEGAGAY
ncbi:MAG: hypothetical protein K5770_04475 [Lachnospiraceae bacterium]|nr:hypothetical protein [Lachnospiraceae bacterium]